MSKPRDLRAGARKINQAGLELIKMYEGFSPVAYRCPAGRWTIGYGHTATAQPGQSLTEWQAHALLRADLQMAERCVAQAVRVPLNDNQFAALVSLVFNIGPGAFSRSALLKKLNEGEVAAVPGEFMRWTKVGALELPGLVRRRTAETNLWRQTT